MLNNKTMNTIKVPYMPISDFDVSDVSKIFSQSPPANESTELVLDLSEDEDEDEDEDEGGATHNIMLVLVGMGMEKYKQHFKNVPFDTFIQLNDADLQELGITDPKDREIITENLSVHQTNKNNTEIQIEDLQIVNNIYNQLLLIQKYCAYVELQMRKHPLTDYIIEEEEFASYYLREYTKAALTQTKILKQAIYDGPDMDAVLTKIKNVNNLSLPKSIKTSLEKLGRMKKAKKNLTIIKVMTIVGVSILVIILQKVLHK